MLDMITRFITPEKRTLNKYSAFLDDQNHFINRIRNRSLVAPAYESKGLVLLRYILNRADYEYLATKKSNYSRYMDHLRYIRRDLMKTYDQTSRGVAFQNYFFSTDGFTTNEYIVPIEDVNTLVNLPLHSEKWEDWSVVHPLRMWSCDSEDYSLKVQSDYIKFAGFPPGHAVILLDVIGLILKYFTWYNTQRVKETEERAELTPQQYFLHKYVYDHLYYDLTDNWLLKKINAVIQIEDPDELEDFTSYSLMTDGQYGFVPQRVHEAMRVIYEEAQSIKGNQPPGILLGTKLLHSGTLYQRIEDSFNRYTPPTLKQYTYLHYLMNRDLFRIVFSIYSLRKTTANYANMKRELVVQYNRLLMTSPWNVCQDGTLKRWIENDIRQFLHIALSK